MTPTPPSTSRAPSPVFLTKMRPHKAKNILLTLAEIILCLVVIYLLLLAWMCFGTAGDLPGNGIYQYFAPERVEEKQAQWLIAGVIYAVKALPLLGMEIALRLYRRKQRRNTDEHQTSDNP